MKRYTAAVIGCGRIGFSWDDDAGRPKPASHIGAFLGNPRMELVGAAEVHPERREHVSKFLKGIPVFESAEALFAKFRPEIVAVATPDETHRSIVELAAKRGVKLIICEKPIAVSLEDAEVMIRTCRERGVMLLVNHMRRFDPALRKLGQDIRSGKFGSIQQVRCLYVNGLMNNGTHTVDLLRWYFGEVASVQGWKNGRAAFSHRDDVNVDGILTFKSGLRAHLQSLNVDDYYLFEQEYYGTKAAVFLRDLSLTATIVPATKLGSITGLPELNRARAKTEGKKSRSYFREMARHAVACLDRRARPESTGEDARKALRILLALRKSAETRGSSVRL